MCRFASTVMGKRDSIRQISLFRDKIRAAKSIDKPTKMCYNQQ